ncbi:MAG TPA: XdhC family protein [Acidimicrobiia bacterium]|nr:XdhC family protein [Acidimicrobiia bacterium]
MTDALEAGRALLEARRTGALLTWLEDASRALVDGDGTVLAGSVSEQLVAEAMAMIGAGRSGMIESTSGDVFVEVLEPEPRLLVFGAGPIAEALCSMAVVAGFAVEVADPRPAFAREERFPAATAVRRGWPADLVQEMAPDISSYVVSLLHEARFEEELLPALLGTEARYLGALGSNRTHEARRRRLEEAGFSADEIDRIHGPVGLDVGAVTPEEIAVAILAQVVAVRRGAG